MERRTAFADIEHDSRRRTTKRDEFLEQMDSALPWDALAAIIKPHYHGDRRGRRPIGIETVLRMYFLQLWFNLSDEAVEDAVYDSRSFSRFMGVSFGLGERAPDATTLLEFRRIIEAKGLALKIMACADAVPGSGTGWDEGRMRPETDPETKGTGGSAKKSDGEGGGGPA